LLKFIGFARESKTLWFFMDKEAKELFMEQIIPGTTTCKLEGVGGRPNTCPNNPTRNENDHIPKLCKECPGNPVLSTKKDLPILYHDVREARYRTS